MLTHGSSPSCLRPRDAVTLAVELQNLNLQLIPTLTTSVGCLTRFHAMSVMCSSPSIPPKSTNAVVGEVLDHTWQLRALLQAFAVRARLNFRSQQRHDGHNHVVTSLVSLMTLNSSGLPSRYVVSRTGRTSTSEPGRNARMSSMSTVNPPLTLPLIMPVTFSSASNAPSRRFQACARLAFA